MKYRAFVVLGGTLISVAHAIMIQKIPVDKSCPGQVRKVADQFSDDLSSEAGLKSMLTDDFAKRCGKFNGAMLMAIYKINKEGMGKGYDINSGGFNVGLPIDKNGQPRAVSAPPKSNCSSASFAALAWASQIYADMTQSGPSKTDYAQALSSGGIVYDVFRNDGAGIGDVDKILHVGARWRNPKILTGITDSPPSEGTLGSTQAENCPGDMLAFSRTNKSGHSTVSLGNASENGEAYSIFWSSNKGTDGYGISCQKVSEIVKTDFALVRITKPEQFLKAASNRPELCKVADDKCKGGKKDGLPEPASGGAHRKG